MEFKDGETLQVFSPCAPEFKKYPLSIQSAGRVRWEWFYYGRSHLPENRFFFDYVVQGGEVIAKTNVDWYEPELKPSPSEDAVVLA